MFGVCGRCAAPAGPSAHVISKLQWCVAFDAGFRCLECAGGAWRRLVHWHMPPLHISGESRLMQDLIVGDLLAVRGAGRSIGTRCLYLPLVGRV